MKEYGNAFQVSCSSDGVVAPEIQQAMTRMIETDFRRVAAVYQFPEDAKPLIRDGGLQPVFSVFDENGNRLDPEDYPEDIYETEYPNLRWQITGWFRQVGWYYALDA